MGYYTTKEAMIRLGWRDIVGGATKLRQQGLKPVNEPSRPGRDEKSRSRRGRPTLFWSRAAVDAEAERLEDRRRQCPGIVAHAIYRQERLAT